MQMIPKRASSALQAWGLEDTRYVTSREGDLFRKRKNGRRPVVFTGSPAVLVQSRNRIWSGTQGL